MFPFGNALSAVSACQASMRMMLVSIGQEDVDEDVQVGDFPTLSSCVRVKVSHPSEIAWFERSFGIQVADRDVQVFVAPDGWVLACREGPFEAHLVEETAKVAMKNYDTRARLSLFLRMVIKQVEEKNRLGRWHTADSWVSSRRLAGTTDPARAGIFRKVKRPRTPEKKPVDPASIFVGITQLDGRRITNRFNTKFDTVRTVRKFIDENRTDGSEEYKLAVSMPRYTFVETDLDRTLGVFDLGKSTLLTLVPVRQQQQSVVVSTWFEKLSMPFIMIFSIIMGLLKSMMPSREPPLRVGSVPATERVHSLGREGDDERKSNEYFGGDSTVFMGND
mmetsp:Transcript_4011/g.5845  ORF Transcript_4011/g.5845 Transcript_4011/m.5845 type:complete len:334 (-) Transcript_4011:393-1394(-)